MVEAQSIKVLSLNDAIKMGVDNSRELKISQSKANAASEKYKEYESSLYPTVKASAGYTRLSAIDPFTFQFPNSKERVTLFPVFLNSYTSQVSAYEPIYTGLRAKYTLQAQHFLDEASKFDVEKDKGEVVFNIVNAYYTVCKIRVSQSLMEDNINEIKQHAKETEDYEKQGLAIKNDVLKIQLQLANAEFNKLDLQNSYDIAVYDLGIMLGMPVGSRIQVDTTNSFSNSVKELKTADDYIKEALTNRTDIKASESRNKASESNLEVAKGVARPQLGIGADFYLSNPNPRIIPPEDIFKATWDAGIYLSYDVSSLYTNKHKVAQAKIQQEITNEASALLMDNIRMEVHQSFTVYKESQQKIELAKTTVVQAEENYRTMKSRYTNHIALLSDLMDANQSLLQAKMNTELFKIEAETAYYKLMKAVGNLTK